MEDAMKKFIVVVIAAFVLSVVYLNSALSQDNAGTLVTTRCSTCHNTERICLGLDKKTPEQWKETVARMVGKGTKLTAPEQAATVDFLAGAKKDKAPFCK
jgi:hypothetical protein